MTTTKMIDGNRISDADPLAVSVAAGTVTLTTGDVEIGGVEIKNGADDTRAVVTATPPASGDAGVVVRQVRVGTLTDRSGTIAAGGTAQSLMIANSTRRYLMVQNPSGQSESLWINFTTAAVTSQPSIEIPPGMAFVMEGMFVSTEAVSINAATTAHPVIAKEG